MPNGDLVSEKYKKMQDMHGLPHLERLTETFKLELDEEEEILEQIREEVSDKLFSFSEKIIEPILTGMESYSNLFEQDMISEKKRGEMFQLYRKLQALKWENNLLLMKNDDKKSAEWIKKTWDFWNNELEKSLIEVCEKLSKGWDELKFEKTKRNYYG